MKSMKIFAALAVLFFVSAPAPAEEPSPATSAAFGLPKELNGTGTFTLLTYNVAGLPQGISQSQPLVNTPQISPRLNAFDIVLAQEDFFYGKQLRSKDRHEYYAPRSQAGVLGDGLSRFSRFPMSEVEHLDWEDCHGYLWYANDCLTPKGFSFARHTLAPGVEIDIYALHMDAGEAKGDQEARSGNTDQLLAFIRARSAGRAVIVGGDTNLNRKRPRDMVVLARLLEQAGLQDSCRVLKCDKDRIDRILFRGSESLQLQPVAYKVEHEHFSVAGLPLSDHLPVSVSFRWVQNQP